MEEKMKDYLYLSWLFKLAVEEYKGDINLLLLEMNIAGHHNKWYFMNEDNQILTIKPKVGGLI